MKSGWKISVLAVAVMATPAAAQSSATATTEATIVRPLSVTNPTASKLSFGRLAPPSTGTGTATVTQGGSRSVAGGVVAVGGTVSAATFKVDGESSLAFNITAPNFNLNGPNATTLAVAVDAPASGTLSGGAIGSDGTTTFSVGGALSVPTGAAPGAYSGTLTVTVAYQ